MDAVSSEKKLDLEQSIYVGAIVAGVVSLLPYFSLFVFPAFVIGPIIAVRYFVSSEKKSMSGKEGAKLGFYSSLLGATVSIVIFDLVWQLFDYQIGQHQNSQLMLALMRPLASERTVDLVENSLAQSEANGFALYMIIVQLIGVVFFAGVFGTLTGLISSKLIRPKLT